MLAGWALAGAAPVMGVWGGWANYDGSSHGMWFVLLTLAAIVGLAPAVHRPRGGKDRAGPASDAAQMEA
jgi:hypothetical protein